MAQIHIMYTVQRHGDMTMSRLADVLNVSDSNATGLVDRYHLRDKHGATRTVYNAKINIHRDNAEPIFLGIQSDHLGAFNASKVESVVESASRDRAAT